MTIAGTTHLASMDDVTSAGSATTEPTPTKTGPLTPRQVEILQAFADGESGPETAARLGLSIKTIEAHRARAYKTLGAKSAPHAVAIAIRRRILAVELDPIPSTDAPATREATPTTEDA